MILLPVLMLLQAPDAETYDALISCAAFHSIEGERLARDAGSAAGDAQLALARDFSATAKTFQLKDAGAQAVEDDLARRKAEYLDKLGTGDITRVAEQWTALDLACQELYPMLKSIPASGESR